MAVGHAWLAFERPVPRKPAVGLDLGCLALSRLGRDSGLETPSCLYFVLGTEVRFGVDCTRLADAFELHHREFDRIYFNFPHCGRKAGVAKNRELLAKFFQR